MTNRYLFLFGGSPPFSQQVARKFSELSLKSKGKVAILFIKRNGWEEYLQQKYTSVLQNHGLKQFRYIALTSSPAPEIIEELVKQNFIGNLSLKQRLVNSWCKCIRKVCP